MVILQSIPGTGSALSLTWCRCHHGAVITVRESLSLLYPIFAPPRPVKQAPSFEQASGSSWGLALLSPSFREYYYALPPTI